VTDSAAKHELLFNSFGMNYNNEKKIFKKGSILIQGYELKQKHNELSQISNLQEESKNE